MPVNKEENNPANVKQFIITTAAGKRLIAKALAEHPLIRKTLVSGTIVIVAGTTNGYVAEEILNSISANADFSRKRFLRGIILPPAYRTAKTGRLPDESAFPGDVIIKNGIWHKSQTIFDVIDDLKEGDIIIKGANALDISLKRAAVLIGHPKAGTIGVALQAVAGRRVQLILPVGLEKRITGNLDEISNRLNMVGAQGSRLWPVPGIVFTEIDAISLLTGATSEMIAAGGVCGAEGSVLLAIYGTLKQIEKAEILLTSISSEPLFTL